MPTGRSRVLQVQAVAMTPTTVTSSQVHEEGRKETIVYCLRLSCTFDGVIETGTELVSREGEPWLVREYITRSVE